MNLILTGVVIIAGLAAGRYRRYRREYGQGKKLGERIIADLEARGADLSLTSNMELLLYFPAEEGARRACPELEALAYHLEIRHSTNGSWLALCRKRIPAAGAGLKRSELETIAKRHGGEYDGWNVAVS